MRLITAVIKPFKFDEVKSALQLAGVNGLTVTEVSGYGRQGGHREVYRGAEYQIDLVPKLKLDILVADADAVRVLELVVANARTGTIGDGKVWWESLDHVVRIRTGERGDEAI